MATQSAQASAPDEPESGEQLSIAEMSRLMDVAAALRKERLTAEQQLNIGETKRMLRERLLESARVSGDPVTEVEIDAAIEAYFERLHEFQPAEPGVATFLGSLYVRRGPIFRVTITLAAAAAVWWSVFALGLVGKKRTERIANDLYQQVQQTAAAIEETALVPDLKERVNQLTRQAEALRDAGKTSEIQVVAAQLTEQQRVLNQQYTLEIVQEGTSGRERLYEAESGDQVSGYYVIVQARSADGSLISLPIRDAETGKVTTVQQWGEQVSEEVFNRVAQDKEADGVVDEVVFAKKEVGRVDPTVQMTGPDGSPLARGRQITRW